MMGTAANQEGQRDLLTREALADVDADRVVDHQVVLAWLDVLQSRLNRAAKESDN